MSGSGSRENKKSKEDRPEDAEADERSRALGGQADEAWVRGETDYRGHDGYAAGPTGGPTGTTGGLDAPGVSEDDDDDDDAA